MNNDFSEILEETDDNSYLNDIKVLIKDHIQKFGSPKGSFYDESVLEEIRDDINLDEEVDDLDLLREAIEELSEGEGHAANVINNNLKFFDDK